MAQTNPHFLNGVPELLVLRLLSDGEMYGYELVQAIREATDESIVLAEGVIYPMLHTLERDGALRSRRQTVAGRSRVYYGVTPAGADRFARLAETWQQLNRTIGALLAEPRHV
jgi:PadR family transcriptional regulator PadR